MLHCGGLSPLVPQKKKKKKKKRRARMSKRAVMIGPKEIGTASLKCQKTSTRRKLHRHVEVKWQEKKKMAGKKKKKKKKRKKEKPKTRESKINSSRNH